MAAIMLGCYYPHILAAAMLGLLVLYGLHRHSPDAGVHAHCCAMTARRASPELYSCIMRGWTFTVPFQDLWQIGAADVGRRGLRPARAAAN